MKNWGYNIFMVLLLAAGALIVFRLLWVGIRSLMKKPLNLPPSESNWAKIENVGRSNEYVDTYEVPGTGANFKNGIPAVERYNIPKMSSGEVITYEFEGRTYKKNIRRDGLGSGYALYCRRDDPEVVREYIPDPPKPASTAAAYLFIGGFMLIFELAALSAFFS